MPSTRDLRRRIKSVKSTAQITKAMQMVASSKMRRAQSAALGGRPYAMLMIRLVAELDHHTGDFAHPLMEVREGGKRAVLIVSTDRGLCGGLNTNLLREVAQFDAANTVFIAAGRKGAQYVARTKRKLAAEFPYSDTPKFAEARAIAKFVQDLFLKGEVDAVDVLYNRFINTLTQKPAVVPLLPVGKLKQVRTGVGEIVDVQPVEALTEFLFEPNPATVLSSLMPHFVNFGVYQLLLEAKASEQSARMVAMKNATENAGQIIKDLTLEYNKIRQAAITKELLEITTAQMALG